MGNLFIFEAIERGLTWNACFALFGEQGKFALRGLAQSLARELAPKGIHVAHFVIDGGIGKDDQGRMLDPDSIASTYWHVGFCFEMDPRRGCVGLRFGD